MSPAMTLPFWSIGPWPDTNMRSPYVTPGENGKFRGGGPVLTASFLIAQSLRNGCRPRLRVEDGESSEPKIGLSTVVQPRIGWSGVPAQVSKSVKDLEERVHRETLGSFLGDDRLEFRDFRERHSSKRGTKSLAGGD